MRNLRKAVSFALALVMCLGLTVPAFAAEDDQPLTRADLALLAKQYVKPDPNLSSSDEELPDDCAGLPKSTQEAILYTLEQGIVVSMGSYGPDREVTRAELIMVLYNAVGKAALEKDPSLRTAPEMPDGETAPSEAEWDAYSKAWNKWHEETLLPLFPDSPAYCGDYLDVVYNMGILQSGTVAWGEAVTKSQAEALFKAACAGGEAVQLGTPLETVKPEPEPDVKPAKKLAKAADQNITIDGKAVAFQTYVLSGTNYVKLRDIAHVLNGTRASFSVGYDNKEKSISVDTGKAYQDTGTEMDTPFAGADKEFKRKNLTIIVNGSPVELDALSMKDDSGSGYTYFKLRDLGKALGFNVGYNGGVYLETDKPYVG